MMKDEEVTDVKEIRKKVGELVRGHYHEGHRRGGVEDHVKPVSLGHVDA